MVLLGLGVGRGLWEVVLPQALSLHHEVLFAPGKGAGFDADGAWMAARTFAIGAVYAASDLACSCARARGGGRADDPSIFYADLVAAQGVPSVPVNPFHFLFLLFL